MTSITATVQGSLQSQGQTQFRYSKDNATGLRIRWGNVDGAYVLDRELTETGFSGSQGTDWERVASKGNTSYNNTPTEITDLNKIKYPKPSDGAFGINDVIENNAFIKLWPGQTYHLETTIFLNANDCIFDLNGAVLKPQDGVKPIEVATDGHYERIQIRNGEIDGNYNVHTVYDDLHGIETFDVTDIIIENLYIHDTYPKYNIDASPSGRGALAILLQSNTKRALVTNCIGMNNGYDAFGGSGAEWITFKNNVAIGQPNRGITGGFKDIPSNHFYAEGNILDGGDLPASPIGNRGTDDGTIQAYDTRIVNNYLFSSFTTSGGRRAVSIRNIEGVVISGNYCDNTYLNEEGIIILDSKNVYITNNSLKNVTDNAFNIKNSINVYIKNNSIVNIDNRAAVIDEDCESVYIESNVFENVYRGIWLSSSDTVILNNKITMIEGGDRQAIRLENFVKKNVTISNNILKNAAQEGIMSFGTDKWSQVSCIGNIITNSGSSAIYLTANWSTIENNTIDTAGSVGIAIYGDSTKVNNNTIKNTISHGVGSPGNDNLIIGNQIDEVGGDGITVGGTNVLVAHNRISNVTDEYIDQGTNTIIDNNITVSRI
jgi:hypothetical protein